jgi:hypothetical protein
LDIAEFVAAEASQPFAWGVTDCCSTADRWIRIRRGISPISLDEWDGSRGAAMECILHPYALPARFNRAMRKAGIKRTIDPQPGDVGLVLFDRRACVAIHTGAVWFSRHEDGLVGAPLKNVWKAWKI